MLWNTGGGDLFWLFLVLITAAVALAIWLLPR